MTLVDSLIQGGWLKTDSIKEAFKIVKREDFLPEGMEKLSELNEALPIGFNQTISQPAVVAFMLEQLQPKPGEKILDIGSGSGWTTALLAYIVSQKEDSKQEIINSNQIQKNNLFVNENNDKNSKGKIIAIEIVTELKEFGEKNVAKYNFIKKGIVKMFSADGSKGYLKEAPFDKILASASAEKISSFWKEQLRIGGKIVAPVGSSVWTIFKKSETEFEEIEYPGFVFVPLISKE